MTDLVPIFGVLGVFFAPVLLVWVILEYRKSKLRNSERMALISQGIIPSEEEVKWKKTNPNRFISLRNGIALVGIAVGIIVAFLISEAMGLYEGKAFAIYTASILLFLGIGYLVYFFVTQNMKVPVEDETHLSQE
ncbi:MAG: DUF6249 domain-containing protein [Petrimonas sp.]|jgi:hypothetical protein|nr:MAG: hypothetical protein BWZ00_00821 [Bacteroidetes bacterium ADurb.BinA174]